jgi:hypothetical protein
MLLILILHTCREIKNMQRMGINVLAVVYNTLYSTRMRVFVFISARDPDLLGFTASQAAENLPADYAPWLPAEAGGVVLLSGGDANPVIEVVRRDGFFLAVSGNADEDFVRSTRH